MFRPVLHSLMTVVGVLACLLGIFIAGRAGVSRMFSEYGMATRQLAAVDEAVRLTGSDPEAHYARAIVLSDLGQLDEAIKEFERAAALQPRDYVMWLKLGQARDQQGDKKGAHVAFREAVRLAPGYARLHWQFGNFLLRTATRDEAFAELRRAADADADLLPPLIDLAWGAYEGDAQAVERVLQPRNDAARMALARYFVRRGEIAGAVKLFRAAGDASDKDGQALLVELLDAGRYLEGYEVWKHLQGATKGRDDTTDAFVSPITDGGFEDAIVENERGFGWNVGRAERVRVFQDTSEARSGTRSLCVEWNGDSDPAKPVISQLAVVKPGTRYRLNLSVRAEDVVSGGWPAIHVSDAGRLNEVPLAKLSLSQVDGQGWSDISAEFMTAESTGALRVMLRREKCNSPGPCPVFGRIWLDNISIQTLTDR